MSLHTTQAETAIAVEKGERIAQAMARAIHGNAEIEQITQSCADCPNPYGVNSWAHVYGVLIFAGPIISHASHGVVTDDHVKAITAVLQDAMLAYVRQAMHN